MQNSEYLQEDSSGTDLTGDSLESLRKFIKVWSQTKTKSTRCKERKERKKKQNNTSYCLVCLFTD